MGTESIIKFSGVPWHVFTIGAYQLASVRRCTVKGHVRSRDSRPMASAAKFGLAPVDDTNILPGSLDGQLKSNQNKTISSDLICCISFSLRLLMLGRLLRRLSHRHLDMEWRNLDRTVPSRVATSTGFAHGGREFWQRERRWSRDGSRHPRRSSQRSYWHQRGRGGGGMVNAPVPRGRKRESVSL